MYHITTLPELRDPETNETIRATHFTREEGGEWVPFEERQRGEGYLCALFENGQIWDQALFLTEGSGWR